MEFVPDASSFIILDELGLLAISSGTGTEITVLPEIRKEVESQTFQQLVERGTFHLRALKEPRQSLPPELTLGLGDGEVAVLEYCRVNRNSWALIDDLRARKTAKSLGVRFTGTARFIKHLADLGRIESFMAERLIRGLPERGFFIEPKAIEEILSSKPLEND